MEETFIAHFTQKLPSDDVAKLVIPLGIRGIGDGPDAVHAAFRELRKLVGVDKAELWFLAGVHHFPSVRCIFGSIPNG